METSEHTGKENRVTRLTYFKVNSRGAVPRAILHYRKVEYEEETFATFEEWNKVKKSGRFEFEQLPSLEFQGYEYNQEKAIDIFLAKMFDLTGNNPEEEYLIESLLCCYDDFFPKFRVFAFPMTESEKQEADEKEKEFLDTHAPFFLTRFENRFNKHGDKYMVGDRFTLADIFVTVHLHHMFRARARREKFEPVLAKHAPNLAKLIQRIKENELVDYFSKAYFAEAPA